MSRTEAEIQTSISATITDLEPSVDVKKGPIRTLFVLPTAKEVAVIESEQDRLGSLFSLNFPEVATEGEIEALKVFGVGFNVGSRARGPQTFFRFSRPKTEDVIDLPIGSLVGTSDGLKVFQIVESQKIKGENADAFFNANKRRYEFPAVIEAESVGDDFNSPPFRITRVLTQIDGIDGTENQGAISGGAGRESARKYAERVLARVVGPTGGIGALESYAREFDPSNVKDVILVFSSDSKNFKRTVSRPAVDVFIIGEVISRGEQTYRAVGLEKEILLASPPIRSVSQVTINGGDLSASEYSLYKDTSLQLGSSTRSLDKIVLENALSSGDIVVITYSYNKLLMDIQDDLLLSGEKPFGTDVLFREARELVVLISVELVMLSAFDTVSARQDTSTLVRQFVESEKFSQILLPEDLYRKLSSEIPGVLTVILKKFTPEVLSVLDVETVEIPRGYKTVLSKNSVLKIRK